MTAVLIFLTSNMYIANINFTDILSYASKLSKYTSAPPNFDLLNRDAKIDFEKPYPDEERMRRGLLYWQNSSQQPTEEKCKTCLSYEKKGKNVWMLISLSYS